MLSFAERCEAWEPQRKLRHGLEACDEEATGLPSPMFARSRRLGDSAEPYCFPPRPWWGDQVSNGAWGVMAWCSLTHGHIENKAVLGMMDATLMGH